MEKIRAHAAGIGWAAFETQDKANRILPCVFKAARCPQCGLGKYILVKIFLVLLDSYF